MSIDRARRRLGPPLTDLSLDAMGNRQSQSSTHDAAAVSPVNGDAHGESADPYDNTDKQDTSQPCFAGFALQLLTSLRKAPSLSSEPMASPLPATPPILPYTKRIGKRGEEIDVGELSHPSIANPQEKFPVKNEAYVFLSHTGQWFMVPPSP